jgi:NADPH-dependent 2,4-dienoyl-CoA reductase/sulfur reductase-like enzyme
VSELNTVVIVGSSLAGLRAAETLRLEKYEGRIIIVGAEDRQPYDRPPLSKKVLAGEWEAERISLRKPEDLDKLNVDWRLGSAATALDAKNRIITLASGETISFDGLIIATGSGVRKLPNQPDWKGVHVVRTLDDSLNLRADLNPGARLVVIGAGFIGLEVAATAKARGCEVTVLEGAPAPMMRGLGAEMGQAAALVHADNGVQLRCDVKVAGLVEGSPGAVGGVALAGGEIVPADVVVVGIGVVPATQWLENTELELRDGVVCDATLNAGVPGIYAAGDICRWFNNLYDQEMRVEHWTTASEQGAAAASNLLAVSRGEQPKPYAAVPFFWSDQFTARIQFLGRANGDEIAHVVVGSPEERSFVALYEKDGYLKAALGVSRPKQLMPFRKLLAERATWEQALELVATFVAT